MKSAPLLGIFLLICHGNRDHATPGVLGHDEQSASKSNIDIINEIMDLRKKWQGMFYGIAQGDSSYAPSGDADFYMDALSKGQFPMNGGNNSIDEFNEDLKRLEALDSSGEMWSFVSDALGRLEVKNAVQRNANLPVETKDRDVLPKDYLSAPKADNHIHHSAAMSQKHLLDFITSVLSQSHHVEAILASGLLNDNSVAKFKALVERLHNSNLTLAALGVFSHDDTFNRFDIFNSKYEPFYMKDLRAVFLKPSTFIEVKFPKGGNRKVNYMADLTLDLCRQLPATYFPEWRVSIYGRKAEEWDDLELFFNYEDKRSPDSWYGIGASERRMGSQTVAATCARQVKWMIQVPRIFSLGLFKGKTFAGFLSNIFGPLLKQRDSVQNLLPYISGIDSVDDETKGEGRRLNTAPEDLTWDDELTNSFPFSYYMYFMATGTAAANLFRPGQHKLSFRPHCGEGGSVKHLLACYLLADQIQHGTQISSSKLMQYMYYLSQVPISMSITSNHMLVRKYQDSPFGQLFQLGLFVSLSTDDPMIFFEDSEEENCLLHEFSMVEMVFGLSWVDLAEIAFNSVIMSGYSDDQKFRMTGFKAASKIVHWPNSSQVMSLSNTRSVPEARFKWRHLTWCGEIKQFSAAEGLMQACALL